MKRKRDLRASRLERLMYLLFVHTPICHRLKVGPCGEYCYIHVGERTFRGIKTPLLHALAQADIARIYVVCTRRSILPFIWLPP